MLEFSHIYSVLQALVRFYWLGWPKGNLMIKALLFASLILMSGVAHAEDELLLTGDSWAQFMCWYASIEATFIAHGLKAKVVGCDGATRFGGTAAKWTTYPASAKMFEHLTTDKNIKAVYFSIGGNDFFSVWNKNLTLEQETAQFNQIAANIKGLVDQILKVRPDVKILITGYDYGNFKDYSKIISAYTNLYNDMGKPTTSEMQRAVLRLSEIVSTIADQKQVFYIQHYGLTHYYYGQFEYGLLPGKTKNPKDISPPSDPNSTGGIVDEEASPFSLLNILGIQDAYHPNFLEFYNIAEHSYGHYLGAWFK